MLLGVLAGCNNLLELDPPIADLDRDSVPDVVDNCPYDPNPQQRDSDDNQRGDVCECVASNTDLDQDGVDDACDDCVGEAIGEDSGSDGIDDGCEACAAATGIDQDADGIDDACDPCTRGAPHDEDGDGVDDGCDVCPTQPNADQAPGVCDRGIAGPPRFDPFVRQDLTLWPGIATGWTWVADGVTLDGTAAAAARTELAERYLVETRGSTNSTVSLQCSSSDSRTTCSLVNRQLRLEIVTGLLGGGITVPDVAMTGSLPGTGPVRFQLRVDGSQSACQALDAAGGVLATASLNSAPRCTRLKIAGAGTSRLEYLWIVGDQLAP